MLDVGSSAHSQLEKLRGQDREQARDEEESDSVAVLGSSGSRILRLQLTDGARSITGVEYAPLTGISIATPPGTKVVYIFVGDGVDICWGWDVGKESDESGIGILKIQSADCYLLSILCNPLLVFIIYHGRSKCVPGQ